MSKCLAVSPFTMPAALAAADSLLGNPTWSGERGNEEQIAWLASFRRRAKLAASMTEIRRNATEDPLKHVAWLESAGWKAQITGGNPGDIFLAAVLNIVAKWPQKGTAFRDGDVDRVLLDKGAHTSPAAPGEHPVVEVATQHPNFSFCFQQVAIAPAGTKELMTLAHQMVTRDAREEVFLDFPMVDLLFRDDARYMLGLRSGANVVTQAAEQLRLELNEVGGRASAAAELVVSKGASMARTIVIDGPFVVAINRNGAPKDADKVAFAAYVDRDAWRKPAEGRI